MKTRSNVKYIIYVRKSSESEDRQCASIGDQIVEAQKIADRLGLHVVEIIEEKKSAKVPGREGFNTLIERLESGYANGVICWKLNRLSRNPIDGGRISWLLQQGIIKSIQTSSHEYLPKDNVIMMQVELGMATQYSRDLSVDTRRGSRRKAERGWYPAVFLPPGYYHVPHRHNKNKNRNIYAPSDPSIDPDVEIALHPEDSKTVKYLFELMLSGKYSVRELKRKGDALGLRTRNGTPLSKNTYYRMFTNTFYCGFFTWKDEDGNPKQYQGKHTPLITKGEYRIIQDIISGRSITRSTGNKTLKYRGYFKCKECGCAFTGDHKKRATCEVCKRKFSIKKRTTCPQCNLDIKDMENPRILDIKYYRCTKSKGKCTQSAITEDRIDELIDNTCTLLSFDNTFTKHALDELLRQKIEHADMQRITQVKKEQTKLTKRLQGVRILRADGEFTQQEYEELSKQLKKDIRDNVNLLEKLKDTYVDPQTLVSEFLENLSKLNKKAQKLPKTEKLDMMLKVLSNPCIHQKNLYFSTPKLLLALNPHYDQYILPQSTIEPHDMLKSVEIQCS